MKRSWKYALLGSAVAIMVGVTGVEAADDPANAIAYRQKVMKAMDTHLGAIVSITKIEGGQGTHIAAHARSIHSLSLMLPDIFPPGSDVGETRAKPEIWQDTAKFEAAIEAFQTDSAWFARTADPSSRIGLGFFGMALRKVGEACDGCHKLFRKPKQ